MIFSNMIEDTLEEKLFRERYRQQLRELKDDHALEDERKKVKHQALKTPRRRGEEIKNEEIDREIIRRHYLTDKP